LNMNQRILLLCLSTIFVSGCSILPFHRNAEKDLVLGAETLAINPDPDLIAQNLVYALAQIPSLHPLKTTVQMKTPGSRFGQRVKQRIVDAGYGVQIVDSDQGDYYVRYSAEHSFSDVGERIRYRILIGNVSIERDYKMKALDTVPNSYLVVKGSPKREMVLNDGIFSEAGPVDELPSEIIFRDLGSNDFVELTSAEIYTQAQETRSLSDSNVGKNIIPTINTASVRTSNRKNMYETLESNFEDIFVDYDDIEEMVLAFDNDSLRLGNKNKMFIGDFVKRVDPKKDIVSIVGCSHGKTSISNGNSLLALGRANRVKEALLYAGLDHSIIYDEGCWAPHYFDEIMPRRGVVITLKRDKASG